MDRDAFFKLPPSVALRVLFDCLDEDTVRAIGQVEAPKAPLPPKFDQIIFRSGGCMWASECDMSGLEFWAKRAAESSDPKYAESDAKKLASLKRWIAWREWYPDAVWSGERNREPVVAKAPSAKPTVYPRAGNGHRPPPPPPDDGIDPDSEIPF
ncbi:MAG TPA: hypothetical protein VGK73_12460 [Polyangiaceae bacterium]